MIWLIAFDKIVLQQASQQRSSQRKIRPYQKTAITCFLKSSKQSQSFLSIRTSHHVALSDSLLFLLYFHFCFNFAAQLKKLVGSVDRLPLIAKVPIKYFLFHRVWIRLEKHEQSWRKTFSFDLVKKRRFDAQFKWLTI